MGHRPESTKMATMVGIIMVALLLLAMIMLTPNIMPAMMTPGAA